MAFSRVFQTQSTILPVLNKANRVLGIWLWLGLFAVAFSLMSPYFLGVRNMTNIARQASVYAFMATGMTLVIITGGIDLSVGSVVSLTSAVLGVAWQVSGSLTTIGVLVGLLDVPPFVASFGMLGIAGGLAFAVTPSSIGGFPESFEYLGNGMIAFVPVPVVAAILVSVAVSYLLFRTPFGLHVFAIGGNESAARLAGINIGLHKVAAYVINGVLASVAGIVLCSRVRSSYPGIGKDIELDVIAMAVIGGASLVGGRGSIVGAIGGTVFVVMIQNIFNLLGVYPFMQKVITGVVIVFAVVMYQKKE